MHITNRLRRSSKSAAICPLFEQRKAFIFSMSRYLARWQRQWNWISVAYHLIGSHVAGTCVDVGLVPVQYVACLGRPVISPSSEQGFPFWKLGRSIEVLHHSTPAQTSFRSGCQTSLQRAICDSLDSLSDYLRHLTNLTEPSKRRRSRTLFDHYHIVICEAARPEAPQPKPNLLRNAAKVDAKLLD